MTTTEQLLPPFEVQAGAPTAYSFGLFSLPPTAVPEGTHWEASVTWQSRGCNDVGVTNNRCTVESPVPALTPNVVCDYVTAPSFTLYSFSDETTGGEPVERKLARARDVLTFGEQWKAESVVWAQLAAAAGAADATAADAVEAIAMAEQLITSVYGGTGVIHLSRYAATLAGTHVLSAQGTRLRTMLGTSVVAGGGYGDPPEAPADGFDLFVTGEVKLLRGAIVDLTGETYNSRINDISALVFRTYVIGWDCAVFRVSVPAT